MFQLLQDAIQFVIEHVQAGVECPCCGQNCKEHLHEVKPHQADNLEALYLFGEPLHKRHWLTGDSGGFTPYVLRHFGLIMPYGTDETKPYGRSGKYVITALGKAWIEDRATIPKTIWVFNNIVTRESQERITFKQVKEAKRKGK